MDDPVDWKSELGPELGAEVAGVGRDLASFLLEHFRPVAPGAMSGGIAQDDRWTRGELAWAAICYTAPGEVATRGDIQPWVDPWPWVVELDHRPSADAEIGRRIDCAMEGAAYLVREILRLRRKRIALANWYDLARLTPVPATAQRLEPGQGAQERERRTIPPALAALDSIAMPEPRLGQRLRWRTTGGVWDLVVTGVCRDSAGGLLAVYTGPKRWQFDGSPLCWPPSDVEIMDP
jgi:hypothetical protein